MAEFSFTYRAFISYAHADHVWAVWLHKALERYRVPRRLAGTENVRRLGRMFRDEEELAAAAELGPKIDAALKGSDVLIVVCSPRSAKSKWVNQEIEAFKKCGREHRVFALILDGTPHGAEDDCFPEALKRKLDGSPAEPLAVDVRKFGREDAALRLIAGMLDVGYDDLRQREVRRRRAELRRAQTLFASGLILVAAALTGGYFAASNYVETREQSARIFAREANTLADEGDYAKAMLLALYADPAAQAGIVEQALRPGGYDVARNALARGYTGNRLAATFDGHGEWIVAISPDRKRVLRQSKDGSLKLLPLAGGDTIATFAVARGRPPRAAFSPDGRQILIGSGEAAKLWPAEGGAALATFSGHESVILSVAFSPDGRYVAAGGRDGVTKVWPATGGEAVATFDGSDQTRSIVFSPDSKQVLTGGDAAELWPIEGGPALGTFSSSGAGAANSVAFSPEGKNVLGGFSDGTLRMWRESTALSRFAGHEDEITSVAHSPDGKYALTGSLDGTAKLWRADGINSDAQFTFNGHQNPVLSVAFAPDGKTVLTASDNGTAKLWLTEAGTEKAAATFAGSGLLSVAVSPDGSRVLIASSQEATATLWPGKGGGVPLATLGGHDGQQIRLAAFSMDGKHALTASRDTAKIWSAEGGEAIATVATGETSRAFSPDGKFVLTSPGNRTANLWSMESGEVVTTFEGHKDAITSAAFSPDGKYLVTGSSAGDGTAKVWSVAGGAALATLAGHEREVWAVAFSPDGRRVLTGGFDRTAKLWPAEGGNALATFTGHTDQIMSVAFSPDNRFVLTGSRDGTSKLWPADGGSALATFEGEAAGFGPDSKQVLTKSGDAVKLWPIPAMIFSPAKEQTRAACEKLREIGVMEFSEADYQRFPILDRNAPHPCRQTWGFDLAMKGQDEASATSAAAGRK